MWVFQQPERVFSPHRGNILSCFRAAGAIVMQSGHFCRVSSRYGQTDNKADLFTSPPVKSYCFCLAGVEACYDPPPHWSCRQMAKSLGLNTFQLTHTHTHTHVLVCACVCSHVYTHKPTHSQCISYSTWLSVRWNILNMWKVFHLVLWISSAAEQIYWQL